jgi:hypothetical protein
MNIVSSLPMGIYMLRIISTDSMAVASIVAANESWL